MAPDFVYKSEMICLRGGSVNKQKPNARNTTQNLMPQMTSGGGIKNKKSKAMEQHRLLIH